MSSVQSKRQKVTTESSEADEPAAKTTNRDSLNEASNFGVDVDDLTDDTDTDTEDDELDDDNALNGDKTTTDQNISSNHLDIQEQLAAAGPAGVAAAAAIATARKRKRPHSFETNPSVRKRQQTRLIRKLRACIDEYTMRVGQQAVVLITMPGKAVHNFKVFGAQPLESVIRTCKHEIMSELEQALLEQAPQQFKEDANKHELPPLVIDGIPTPVEKMTQAQLRAFIPLMLKYSTGRGKPGWGKDTTRPPWWPETLPWANVRSDARDESEKQRISWTTTLRQIVTNCYKFHGRDDLLPTFDENEDLVKQDQDQDGSGRSRSGLLGQESRRVALAGKQSMSSRHSKESNQVVGGTGQAAIYQAGGYASNFVHTITNSDGSVSLIQVDPANAQILTLPDGTQVRAVRLQTLGSESLCGQTISELHEASAIEINASLGGERQLSGAQTLSVSEASLGADGQIILTGEDGVQSCYPMSSLVSIPASVYQQFSQGGQQLSIMTADGTSLPANAVSIHAIQEQPQELQEVSLSLNQQQQVTTTQSLVQESTAELKSQTEAGEVASKAQEQSQEDTSGGDHGSNGVREEPVAEP